MPLFVSGKRYRKLQEIATNSQNTIVRLQTNLGETRRQLEKQESVNKSLIEFSEKFKEFYERVTKVPVITKTSKSAVTLTSSSFIDDVSASYGHAVESMKSQMIYDLVKHLERSGLIQFDLVDDPLESRVVYKATINIIPPGGDINGD